jgi:hypothetical protein
MGYRRCRLRSIGKARRVAEIEIVGIGDAVDHGAENRKAANAGIKNADLRSCSTGQRAG